jgi:recombination associated protein RdgC
MWFNNACTYSYELSEEIDFASELAKEALKPCPPHARFTYGWLPVFQDQFIQEVAGASLFCLGKEEKILPKAVINKILAERIQELELKENRSIKRAERAKMAEDLEFDLLPKSFCIQKKLLAMLDTVHKKLIINTSSENQASQLISSLIKTIPGLQIKPFFQMGNQAKRLVDWISNPAALPPSFQLATDCSLFSLADEKKKVNCKGYELPADEIVTLLSQGLAAAELSLIWNERIQFTLTQDLTYKRLKTLDYLIDDYQEINELEEEQLQRDAGLTLLCGELRKLTTDLLVGLE